MMTNVELERENFAEKNGMTMDGGMWVNFDWFSHRKQVKS